MICTICNTTKTKRWRKDLCYRCYSREWRRANREKCNAIERVRYSKNLDEERTKNRRKQRIRRLSEEIKRKELEYSRKYEALEKTKALRRNWPKNNVKTTRARTAKRRARRLKATPQWSNLKEIKKFYKNCPKNMEVDHIVPLSSNYVCGLHVIENLQYLSPEENKRKGNRWPG